MQYAIFNMQYAILYYHSPANLTEIFRPCFSYKQMAFFNLLHVPLHCVILHAYD